MARNYTLFKFMLLFGTALVLACSPAIIPTDSPQISMATPTAGLVITTRIPSPTPIRQFGNIIVEVTPSKKIYAQKEPIDLTITLKNDDPYPSKPVALPPQITLWTNTNQMIWQRPAGTDKRSIVPGEIVSYEIEWDQFDSDGKPSPPGSFSLTTHFMTTTQQEFSINSGLIFTIEKPHKLVPQIIRVNSLVTNDEITITLLEITIDKKNVIITAKARPADYQRSPGFGFPHPAHANIRIGQQTFSAIGEYSNREEEDGVWLQWIVAPAVSNVKDLEITITDFMWTSALVYRGPWTWLVTLP